MAAKKQKSRKKTSADLESVRGQGGELHQQRSEGTVLSTNDGIAIADNQNSLAIRPGGPTLLEDFVLQEKISHFDRERIPERVVHARGTTAHGYFELTDSLAEFTTARVLTVVGARTPVLARLSTVVGASGSADTVRDTRGFSVKFYTDQGNWDLVGNNIPVFFIQDAMKFPDLVHSVKREPDRGFPSASSAHDTFWDFISLTPEATHHLLWVMSDRGIPRSLRTMEGFGVHTFQLVNANGDATFVKYHWRPHHGVAALTWDEAVTLAGADPDFHRRDLWESIERGDQPGWDLGVQLFTAEDAERFAFDPLDPTKLITEEDVPVRIVGRMVLDLNVENVFAENELAAFSPMRILPGMDFSADPLLQGRLFSYLDAQLHRLGGSNFQQLAVNAPRCPVANYQRDGFFQGRPQGGRVGYEPNSLDEAGPRETPGGFASAGVNSEGSKARWRPATFADHYSQARQFYRSQAPFEQSHIVDAIVFELGKVETPSIRHRMVANLRQVDESLATRVAAGIGLAEPPEASPTAVPVRDLPLSPALRYASKAEPTLRARSVGILVAKGTDLATVERASASAAAAGATVKIVSPTIEGVTAEDGTHLAADCQLSGTTSAVFDAIAIVLSAESAETLCTEHAALDFARHAFAHLKGIGVDEGGRRLLHAAGIRADEWVVDLTDPDHFLTVAAERHPEREPSVRNLP